MNPLEFCRYPPQLAADVEVSARNDSEAPAFIIGSSEIGRYLSLGLTEHRVIQLLDGTLAPPAVCSEMDRRHGINLADATLTRFLTKLDNVGILAGARNARTQELLPGNRFYLRWRLFNPDRLFARILPRVWWIWTPGFFAVSLTLLAVAAFIAFTNWVEVELYARQLLEQHYLAVMAVAWLVVVSHEFAHGMTSKAFGGRATEIGALLIYYCLPGLYCNVSGLYLIPERSRRLWVIAAGLYWQVFVGAAALIEWFLLAPYTLPADLAMIFVLGSFLNMVFNANPLIKLDGYYFLSQYLRLPNLMDRSRAYWRGILRRIATGQRNEELKRLSTRERRIYLVFGLLSSIYNVALPLVIFWYAFQFLTDNFRLLGLVLTLLLGFAYLRMPLLKLVSGTAEWTFTRVRRFTREEQLLGNNKTTESTSGTPAWRRRLIIATPVVFSLIALCIPWTASVGSYGALVTRPDREATILAPENGSLISLNVKPGQQVERGRTIGRLGNLDLEEQIVKVRTELARVGADSALISGDLRVRQAGIVDADLRFRQRDREFKDLQTEEQQIQRRIRLAESKVGSQLVSSSQAPIDEVAAFETNPIVDRFPALLAALEATEDVRRARAAEAETKLERSKKLFAEGILARADLDVADANASTLAADLAEARQQLSAALIEHRRRYQATQTDLDLSQSGTTTARVKVSNLHARLNANHVLVGSLQERLDVLERKHTQFALAAPISGTVFGEDLSRLSGHYFSKGMEICRIADVHEMLVRVNVSERDIGDIGVGKPVRIKTKAFPNRIFHGRVLHIGGESDMDQNRQPTYRVELTVQNDEEFLRPGMTAFARIDFGQHMIGWILVHKTKQLLRPELWML